MPKIIVGLATIPERSASLRFVLHSLVPQAGQVHVALNRYKHAEAIALQRQIRIAVGPTLYARVQFYIFPEDRYGDAAKFLGARYACSCKDSLYLACDDDIIYPPDYAHRLMLAARRYGPTVVVGYHAKEILAPIRSFYLDRHHIRRYHFAEPLERDTPVNMLGTATLAFSFSAFGKFPKLPDAFPADLRNAADLHFAKLAFERGLSMMALSRAPRYIRQMPSNLLGGTQGGIYADSISRDREITAFVNERAGPTFYQRARLPKRVEVT